MEVEVRIKGGAEPMKEAERPELSVAGRTRARAVQGGADGSDEDAQDGAGDVRVVVQVGTQPLGKAQHPTGDEWRGNLGPIDPCRQGSGPTSPRSAQRPTPKAAFTPSSQFTTQ